MLRLILGRAGSGKTQLAMDEIKGLFQCGEESILIVPEQYSHDAERQLCAVCGNSISLGAEVLSFSRICSRVFTETGRLGDKILDPGGRVLLMHLAQLSVQSKLSAFRVPGNRTDFLSSLIEIYDEIKTSSVSTDDLINAGDKAEGSLKNKLYDLALIFSAYDALRPKGVLDPKERLSLLAEDILDSNFGDGKHIFIDGFSDFTKQEVLIVDSLLRKNTDITVCLTCDDLEGDDDEFAPARKTARRLIDLAKKRKAELKVSFRPVNEEKRSKELVFIEKNVFGHDDVKFEDECKNVCIYRAKNIIEECELAASYILDLVRTKGYRYRDMAVVARDWEKYSAAAENTFEKYGIPVMTAEKSDILEKPIMTLITAALDIATNDWDHLSVFRYLKTGLVGIETDKIDLLENYVLKWSIRGRKIWTREEGWTFDPEGYIQEGAEKHDDLLYEINEARKEAAAPLNMLDESLREAETADEKAKSLYAFLEEIKLPERLSEKAKKLRDTGRIQEADEHEQIWGIIVSALEQTVEILKGRIMDRDEFAALFKLVLSKYEVGTIPPALDRVALGGMLRVRHRGVKCLVLMGATDDAVPKFSATEGMLSDDDRTALTALGIELSEDPDNRLMREMSAIYATLTMVSDKLCVSYPESARPSFLASKILQMFNISPVSLGNEAKTAAILPLFELAVTSESTGADEWAAAAKEYFDESGAMKEKFEAVKRASHMPRGRLSQMAAEKLYSREINTTASRVDKFYSCKFSFFLQYGLKAKPRNKAGFDAPEVGTFLHYLLEKVTKEASDKGGFSKLDDEEIKTLTRKYVERYAEEVLEGFKDKTGRFKYLFYRLVKDAEKIVLDMAAELRNSHFQPVDFELDFSGGGDLPPAEVSDEDVTVKINGRVDRVDGWVHGDKLYLRVVDYKTGKKEFNLSDVVDGLGIQMLVYLFALENGGKERYGKEIVPAGVLYAPARDEIISAKKGMSDDEIRKEKEKALKRKGLILMDGDVIRAMEDSDSPRYIPVKMYKNGTMDLSSAATLEQFGKLKKHIEKVLLEMGKEIRGGGIDADPYYRGAKDIACTYCDYFEACHFDEKCGDKMRRLKTIKNPEAWERIEWSVKDD